MATEIMVKEFNMYQKRAHLAPESDWGGWGLCTSRDIQAKSQIYLTQSYFLQKSFIGTIILYPYVYFTHVQKLYNYILIYYKEKSYISKFNPLML